MAAVFKIHIIFSFVLPKESFIKGLFAFLFCFFMHFLSHFIERFLSKTAFFKSQVYKPATTSARYRCRFLRNPANLRQVPKVFEIPSLRYRGVKMSLVTHAIYSGLLQLLRDNHKNYTIIACAVWPFDPDFRIKHLLVNSLYEQTLFCYSKWLLFLLIEGGGGGHLHNFASIKAISMRLRESVTSCDVVITS